MIQLNENKLLILSNININLSNKKDVPIDDFNCIKNIINKPIHDIKTFKIYNYLFNNKYINIFYNFKTINNYTKEEFQSFVVISLYKNINYYNLILCLRNSNNEIIGFMYIYISNINSNNTDIDILNIVKKFISHLFVKNINGDICIIFNNEDLININKNEEKINEILKQNHIIYMDLNEYTTLEKLCDAYPISENIINHNKTNELNQILNPIVTILSNHLISTLNNNHIHKYANQTILINGIERNISSTIVMFNNFKYNDISYVCGDGSAYNNEHLLSFSLLLNQYNNIIGYVLNYCKNTDDNTCFHETMVQTIILKEILNKTGNLNNVKSIYTDISNAVIKNFLKENNIPISFKIETHTAPSKSIQSAIYIDGVCDRVLRRNGMSLLKYFKK